MRRLNRQLEMMFTTLPPSEASKAGALDCVVRALENHKFQDDLQAWTHPAPVTHSPRPAALLPL